MATERQVADNPWLEKSDIQDLTDAVRGLTMFLKLSDQRHQAALHRLAEVDVVTQLTDTMRSVRDEIRALRTDVNDLSEAYAASVGNGHDKHAH